MNCCIIIQKKSKDIDSLDLRIGIHQGEILIQGNDVVGDDVNIASRIEHSRQLVELLFQVKQKNLHTLHIMVKNLKRFGSMKI